MQNGASTGAVGSAMDLEPDVGALMANLPRFSVIPSLDPYGQTPLRVTSPTSKPLPPLRSPLPPLAPFLLCSPPPLLFTSRRVLSCASCVFHGSSPRGR
eukprot:768737-Hanusia_phi.AAC.7